MEYHWGFGKKNLPSPAQVSGFLLIPSLQQIHFQLIVDWTTNDCPLDRPRWFWLQTSFNSSNLIFPIWILRSFFRIAVSCSYLASQTAACFVCQPLLVSFFPLETNVYAEWIRSTVFSLIGHQDEIFLIRCHGQKNYQYVNVVSALWGNSTLFWFISDNHCSKTRYFESVPRFQWPIQAVSWSSARLTEAIL